MRIDVAALVRQGCDLSLRQMYIMFYCQSRGAVTVKEISESGAGNLNKPAVSRAVQRLHQLGYVTRVEHPDDRRSVLISLTAAGRLFTEAAASG